MFAAMEFGRFECFENFRRFEESPTGMAGMWFLSLHTTGVCLLPQDDDTHGT